MRLLHSYEKVWKIEQKVYSIQNYRLPAPIAPIEILYFCGGVVLVIILNRLIPLMSGIPFLVKYLVLPLLMTKFLRNFKLDGKKPLRYFYDYLVYIVERISLVQFFQRVPPSSGRLRIRWKCCTRTM